VAECAVDQQQTLDNFRQMFNQYSLFKIFQCNLVIFAKFDRMFFFQIFSPF